MGYNKRRKGTGEEINIKVFLIRNGKRTVLKSLVIIDNRYNFIDIVDEIINSASVVDYREKLRGGKLILRNADTEEIIYMIPCS